MNVAVPHTMDHQPAAARAGGSSFYLAMRILQREQREAMFEIYSFCRAVDDIADGSMPRERRLEDLAAWRRDIDGLCAKRTPPGLEGLARAIDHFGLRKEDFLAVIDGMEMDAREDIRAPALQQLDLYCDRVACAVGRLSVRVFGMDEGDGKLLAHHLGRALQLTNILRDIDEDAAVGRLYLPLEPLRLAKISSTDPQTVISHPRVGQACAFVAERAREHFAQANGIMSASPRHSVRAPRIMEGAYRQMLEAMMARGWSPPRTRVRINKFRLLWIALRYAFV
ncbi:MAG: presqualene diphosphate synthase HpnD [Pseudolabrys sp.]